MLATYKGPALEIRLTGYLVDREQRTRFEFLKSVPELFALRSLEDLTELRAFESIGTSGELLPLAIDPHAWTPVPAQPSRLLQRFEFAVTRPDLAFAVHTDRAWFPLTEWDFQRVTFCLPLGASGADAYAVLTTRPSPAYILLSKPLAKLAPGQGGTVGFSRLDQMQGLPSTSRPAIYLRYGPHGWEAEVYPSIG